MNNTLGNEVSRSDRSCSPTPSPCPPTTARTRASAGALDVVLHGRDTGLTEVKFLHQHNGDKPAPKDQDFVQHRHLRPRQQRLPLGRRDRRLRGARALPRRRAAAGPRAPARPGPRGAARLLDGRRRHLAPRPAPARPLVRPRPRRRLHHDARLRQGPARPAAATTRKRACTSTTPSTTPRTPSTCRSSPTPAPRTRRSRPPTTSRRGSSRSACR